MVATIESECYTRDIGGLPKLFPHQKRILNHMFKPVNGRFRYTTFVISMIKKSGKTALATWLTYAFARLYGGEMYSVANDERHAKRRMFSRLEENLKYMKEKDPELFNKVMDGEDKVRKERIVYGETIRFANDNQPNMGPHDVNYLAVDYAGEAGAMNALVVYDEIWGITSERAERLWTELPPLPAVTACPVSIRLVTTYAGFYGESDLLYGLYDRVVKPDPHTEEPQGNRVPGLEDLPVFVSDDGSTIVYWDHEPRMPWHTLEYLSQQKNDPTLRPSEYKRLWENRWSTGSEAFLDMDVVRQAMDAGREMGLVNNFASLMK